MEKKPEKGNEKITWMPELLLLVIVVLLALVLWRVWDIPKLFELFP
jgi:hypothetical protein